MDLVLDQFDHYIGDTLFRAVANDQVAAKVATFVFGQKLDIAQFVSRDYIPRQLLSLFALTYAGIFFLYFGFALLAYYTVFNHEMKRHPRFLKNQIRQEIKLSMDSFVPVGLMTLPWFLGDVRGHSMLYTTLADGPTFPGLSGKTGQIAYLVASTIGFLLFTDYAIYWVHRALHHPILYKRLHKPHHRFIIPTPFASHAFHPLDGYANSLPYHIYTYIVPVHKGLFLFLFMMVNCFTIFIHDSEMISDSPWEAYLNGPSHHTLHHLYFNVNYGQYFTYADKLGGSFRNPQKGEDPLLELMAADAAREKAMKEVEGSGSENESEADSGFESGSNSGKSKTE